MFEPKEACFALRDQIAGDRNYLHENPELSGQEVNTLTWIIRRLQTLGIPCERVEHGGLVAVLSGAGPGKRLLLRADIDALPVGENECNLTGEKTVVSQIPGVSHVCGHDAHTAMLLGALEVLAARRDHWDGEIVAVFEQGEETAYGVMSLLAALTTRFDGIDGSFALHIYADGAEGTLSIRPGYVMSGSLSYDITLAGAGGHSSRPDYCCNPIDCFVSIYHDLASARMRRVDPTLCLTHAVGVVEAGSASNIIPETLRFAGTARFLDEEACGKPFLEELKRCVESNASLYGCTAQYNRLSGPAPGVYNDGVCAALAAECLGKALGDGALREAPVWTASETMSLYHILYPGVLVFLGIRSGEDFGGPHHSPEFDLDEGQLYLGAAAHVAYALGFLDRQFHPPERRAAPALLEDLQYRLFDNFGRSLWKYRPAKN